MPLPASLAVSEKVPLNETDGFPLIVHPNMTHATGATVTVKFEPEICWTNPSEPVEHGLSVLVKADSAAACVVATSIDCRLLLDRVGEAEGLGTDEELVHPAIKADRMEKSTTRIKR